MYQNQAIQTECPSAYQVQPGRDVPRTSITSHLGETEENLSLVESTLGQMYSQLRPVLRQGFLTDGEKSPLEKDGPRKVAPEVSAVGDRLQDINRRLQVMAKNISALTAGLEV